MRFRNQRLGGASLYTRQRDLQPDFEAEAALGAGSDADRNFLLKA